MRKYSFVLCLVLVGCLQTPEKETWEEILEASPEYQVKMRTTYTERKVKLITDLENAKTIVDRQEAYIGLICNADSFGKREEVIFWCKKLLETYDEKDLWKPFPQEAKRLIEQYSK